jgi:hypothetical protein
MLPSGFSADRLDSSADQDFQNPRLRKIEKPTAADYDAFDPADYISEYYTVIGAENQFLLDFYHRAFQHIPRAASFLEFGGGPTIYQLLSARRRAGEIVFAEYLASNRAEVQKWIAGHPEAFNWEAYVDAVLELEQRERTDSNRRQVREELIPKMTEIIECDAFSPHILCGHPRRDFDVVSSSFCLECISGCESLFLDFLAKLTDLLKMRGTLVLTMLKGAKNYRVGNLLFPAFPVHEDYMRDVLRRLQYHWVSIESVPAEGGQGYDGIIAITAEKG